MKTENEKPKLKVITELSPEVQDYNYGSGSGSCGSGCGTGGGTGPNDCMSQEMFLKLSESGALKSEVYVCGWGWTLPGVTIYGSCGCGSCGSCGSCGGSCGSCGSCGGSCGSCGSSGGGGLGSGGSMPQTLQEAQNYLNVVNNDYVLSVFHELWGLMKSLASSSGRQEVGCWLYYDLNRREYVKGQIKIGEKVSGSTHSSIKRDSPNDSTSVPVPRRDTISAITFIHAHTTFSHETAGIHICGPSPADLASVSYNQFGILLDYVGQKYPGHSDNDPARIYVYKNSGVVATYDL